MDRALYLAMTGAQATLAGQRVVSHNIANATTPGFRADLQATQSFVIPGDGLQSRVASEVLPTSFDASAGSIETTGNPLDVAVKTNGWIAVQAPDGSTAYTRAGSLRVNQLGQLTTAGGSPVMGEGGPIAIPPHDRLSIGADGTITIVPQGQSASTLAVVGRVQVADIAQQDLTRGGDGLFHVKAGAAVTPAAGNTLAVGALESSNVNLPEQLSNMISLARQFELQVKVMKTTEDNERAASTLLRMG